MTSLTMKTRQTRKIATSIAAAAMLLFGLTACAPGNDSGSNLNTDDDYMQSAMEWRENIDKCMLKAGFDLGPFNGNGSESVDLTQFDMAAFDAAYSNCIKEVGEAPVDESLPTMDELFDSQLIFAKCMRDNGYDYPDPVKGSGGMGSSFGPETDFKIVDACTAKANEGTGK